MQQINQYSARLESIVRERSQTWARLVAIFAVGTIAGAGCGSGVSIEELADSYVDAFCQREVKCGLQQSHEACMAEYGPISGFHFEWEISFAQIVESVNAGLVDYDPEKGAACLDALPSSTCRPWKLYPEQCISLLTGLVEKGGECMFNYECGRQHYCSVPEDCEEGCCFGTCKQAWEYAGIGEACGLQIRCEGDDTYCYGSVCRHFTNVGEPCDAESTCEPGSYCHGRQGFEPGECRPRASEGERCTGMFGCNSTLLWCNPETETCEPTLGPGESCKTTGGDGCVWYAPCDYYGTDKTDTCLPNPVVGDPCPDKGLCGNYLVCSEDDVCVAREARPLCVY